MTEQSVRNTGRVPQAERRRAMTAHIMECAEAEFAQKGYDATTFAGVAARAGIDTSLIRYYFDDKATLFSAVFKRRVPAANALHIERLEKYRSQAGDAMTVEGIVDAFTRPSFEAADLDAGWRNYCMIVSFVNSSGGALNDLMSECFDVVAREVIADLRKVLPQAREADLYWAYHFLTGAYTFSLGQTDRIDKLSGEVVASKDFAAIARRLPLVIGAGIRAMCAAGAAIDERPFDPLPPGTV